MPVAYNEKTGEAVALAPSGEWAPTKIAENPQTGERLAFDGTDWVSVGSQKPSGVGSYVDNIVRQVAKGATFGFADEIAAGMNSLVGKKSYEEALADERRRDKALEEESPVAATAANVAGGIAGTIAGGGLLGTTKAGAQAVKAISKAPAVVRGAAIGGATGGLTGFGTGEGGLGERAESAVEGAGIGGIFGAAAPKIATLAGAGLRKVGQSISDRVGQEGAAARKLAEKMAQDDVSVGQIDARLLALGPKATIADAAGPNVRVLAEAAANQPGVALTMAEKSLEGRMGAQGQRIVDSARKALGARGEYYKTVEDLTELQKKSAAPFYDAAYKVDFIDSDTLRSLADRPSVKSALPRAMRIAREEGEDPIAIGLDFDQAGSVIFTKSPSAKTWDYVKRGLDDVVETFRDKQTGRLVLDTEGNAINKTRAALVSELKDLNPDYKTALELYAGPSKLKDAMARGRDFAKGDAEVTGQIIKRLSPSERDFFREGVLREIERVVDSQADGANKARKMLSVPKFRDAMQEAFPSRAAYLKFLSTLTAENKMAVTRNEVLRNSATARRLAAQADMNADVPGIVTELAQGRPVGAVRSAISSIISKIGEMPQGQKDEIGRMLFSQDKAAQRKALAAIGQKAQMIGIANVRKALVENGIAVASGVIGGQD